MKRQVIAWGVFVSLMACFFAWLSAWAVQEQDLFWQIRAGREILQTGQVQSTESWSFTAFGAPWYNFQWLSSVVAYGVSRVGRDHVAFYYWRCLWVAACVIALCELVRAATPRGAGRWVAAIVLLPWTYDLMASRFQLRPELYTIVLFVLLTILWTRALPAAKKRAWGVALLVLWANLHAGTVAFGILFQSLAIVCSADDSGERIGRRLLWALATAATILATPIGWNVFSVLYRIGFEYDYARAGNRDQQPLSWELMRSWYVNLWPVYTLAAAIAYAALWRRRDLLPRPYRSRLFVLGLGTCLTALAAHRVRVFPYQVIFLLPVLASAIGAIAGSPARRWQRPALAALALLTLFFWGFIVPGWVRSTANVRYAGVPDWEVPVRSVEFIRNLHPARNLLNPHRFGGYLIEELPDYPVAEDGRDLPFDGYQKALSQASGNPEDYQRFLDSLGVRTVIDESARGSFYVKGVGYVDPHYVFYPVRTWALVYFDSISLVLLKRVPENQSIIDRYEYHFVHPGIPFDIALDPNRLGDVRPRWEAEIVRCLDDNPRNLYCLLAQSAIASSHRDDERALQLVRAAEAIDSRYPAVFQQYARLYAELGRGADAERAARQYREIMESRF